MHSEQVVPGPAGNWTWKGRSLETLSLGSPPHSAPDLQCWGPDFNGTWTPKGAEGLLRSAGCPRPVGLDPSPCAFLCLWAPECPGIPGNARLPHLPGAGIVLVGTARLQGCFTLLGDQAGASQERAGEVNAE